MKRYWRGFTIIEILVVVAVIGLLSSITIVGFSRYQATTRDSQRESKATVIAEALEKYYEQHGEYPGCSDLTDSAANVTGIGGALETVNPVSLVAPQAADGIDNSIECSDLTSLNDDDIFAYVGDGSGTCTSGSSCLEFTLKYKDEITGQIETITSRRTTDIATSGDIGSTFTATVAAGSAGLNQINLSWPSIPNASSYTLERATNSGFTTNFASVSPSSSSTSYNWTGLTAGTQYFFRIKANASTGDSAWSNTVSATTIQLATPAITATANSLSQITVNWSAVTYATTYTLQRATNSSFTTGLVTTNPTGTSSVITGLTGGTTYYFRLQASASGSPGDTSNWSTTVSRATLSLATPVISANVASSTSVSVTWSDVQYETGYTLQYTTSSSSWTSPVPSSIALSANATSRTVTGLTSGTAYYFRLQATATGHPSSSWSTTQTATPMGQASITSTSAPSCGNLTVNWGTLAGASTYTVRWSVNSNMSSPTTVTGRTGNSYTFSVGGSNQGRTIYMTVAGVTSGGYTGAASTIASRASTVCPPPAYNLSCSYSAPTLSCTSLAVCPSGTTAYYYWYVNGSLWVQGTGYRTVGYTLGYDQSITLSANTSCTTSYGASTAVGGSTTGSATRGIPAPGGHSWDHAIVSNHLHMLWNHSSACAAGSRGYHMWTYRRYSPYTTYIDVWPGNTNTYTRGSLPVYSWISMVQPYCQGATGTYWGGAAQRNDG